MAFEPFDVADFESMKTVTVNAHAAPLDVKIGELRRALDEFPEFTGPGT